jgi:hypothetical protein
MAATLDGMVEATGAVFEAKFMLPWSFTEEGAAEKHMAQLQHNMWVTNAKTAVLSIIASGHLDCITLFLCHLNDAIRGRVNNLHRIEHDSDGNPDNEQKSKTEF